MIEQSSIKKLASKLCLLTYDCYNADLFLEQLDFVSGGKPHHAIDSIYRLYKCGLIFASDRRNAEGKMSTEDFKRYLQLLLNTGSYIHEADKYIIWVQFDICATPLARNLVNRFCLKDEENSQVEAFGVYIEHLFTENNVPWSVCPLIT